jgi:hypothetical protein
MSDSIGRIAVPDLVDSGLTFPLKPDAGFGMTQDSQIVTHQFGSLDAKVEQRLLATLPRCFLGASGRSDGGTWLDASGTSSSSAARRGRITERSGTVAATSRMRRLR